LAVIGYRIEEKFAIAHYWWKHD